MLFRSTVGQVDNVPSYSYFSQVDQTFRWRDLYSYGFTDNLGRGVNYPFLNNAHYPYNQNIFRLIPEGSNTFFLPFEPQQPITDDCE